MKTNSPETDAAAGSRVNPFLNIGDTPDFSDMTRETAEAAIPQLLQDAESGLEKAFAAVRPDWDVLFSEIPAATDALLSAWNMVGHFTSVMNNGAWREIEDKFLPDITRLVISCMQNKKAFEAMTALRQSASFADLGPVKAKITDDSIREAELSGARLPEDAHRAFSELITEVNELSCKYRNNVIDSVRRSSITIKTPSQTQGLPKSFLKETAKEMVSKDPNREAVVKIPVNGDAYMEFMSFAQSREARRRMYSKHTTIAARGRYDNSEIISEICRRRTRIANTLGYGNFAEMTLAGRMLRTPQEVFGFLETLRRNSAEKAREEHDELNRFAKSRGFSGHGGLRQWDAAFWAKKFSEEKFGFSSQSLRKYFVLDKVLDGLFALFHDITGFSVRPDTGSVPVWHPDVSVYNVIESGAVKGRLYIDPFLRTGLKSEGAWMNPLRRFERRRDGSLSHPIAVIACNIRKPEKGKPVLLTYRDVKTVFHEFGHAMQQLLSTQEIGAVSGINGLEWDAAEIASEFMEYWVSDAKILKSISGGPGAAQLPDEFCVQIPEFNRIRSATATMTQAKFAWIDMTLHTNFPSGEYRTFEDVMKTAAEKFSVFPYLASDKFLCSFSHIFAGGYAAGYYSYLWSDALAADMFSAFKELPEGDERAFKETGKRYTEAFLSKGSSRPTMESFIDFRGRKPDISKYPGISAQ